MKIAMVDPSLFTGRYDDSLSTALADGGARVELLARPMRATDAIVPQNYGYVPAFFRQSEALRPLLGEGRMFRAVKAGEYLLQTAGRLDFLRSADVLHWQWLPLPQVDALVLRRLCRASLRPALVHTVHNASAYHGDSGAQGRGYRALLDHFDRLIVHGEETRAALVAQGLDKRRIRIVPHPPMELAQASEADRNELAAARLPRLLFFGTLRPYKGFDVLIAACLAAWRSGAQFELAVAGKPFMDIRPLLAEVRTAGFGERLILDLDFLKEQRLDAHLRAANMIVFPYRHIDSSGAFLSALHYGKPMLCSAVGMFAGLPDGVMLVPPGDARALAESITRLSGNPALRDDFGARALALRSRLCDWSEAAARTQAVYDEAIEERKLR